MKEDLLLNGNAKSKIKGTLFIKFSCVAAYHQDLELMSDTLKTLAQEQEKLALGQENLTTELEQLVKLLQP
jgi:hypothetical protein